MLHYKTLDYDRKRKEMKSYSSRLKVLQQNLISETQFFSIGQTIMRESGFYH